MSQPRPMQGNRPGGPGGPGRGPMGHGPMGMMGVPVQKAKNFRGTLFRLLGYFKPQWLRLTIVFIAAIVGAVFAIVGPKILGLAITKLFDGAVAKFYLHVPGAKIDFTYIGNILLLLLGLYVISSLFTYLQQFTMAGVAQHTVYTMRRQVDEKLGRLPLKFYDSRTHGEIMSRAVNDLDNISNSLQQSVTQLVTALVTLVGVFVIMLTISWLLTLVVLVTLPLSIVATRFIATRSQRYFVQQQRALGELNGHVEEMFTGHRIVKAFGRERQSIAEFNRRNDALYEAGWRAQFVTGMLFPLMNSIGNLGFVLVAVIGGIMVTQRAITFGDVTAFIQYSRQFSQPITQLASIANSIQLTIASAERVFELLDEQEELPDPADAKVITEPRGAVQLEHVDFSYVPDAPLIEDMNIDVKPGQMIAIVGPTGAGKTTLVNLLMRFYEIQRGAIRVDGVNITELRRGDLRRMYGMVLQDTWLFNGTIRENIAYGREDATEEEIVRAAQAAQADHFIRTLPDGYDTVLNQEASNISQGQRQLLTIARSVDTRTEILIQKAMTELMKGRTSFVIAHRLSTVRDAETILVMNHGRIIEQGSHKELLAKGGFYADLYNSQFAARAAAVESTVTP